MADAYKHSSTYVYVHNTRIRTRTRIYIYIYTCAKVRIDYSKGKEREPIKNTDHVTHHVTRTVLRDSATIHFAQTFSCYPGNHFPGSRAKYITDVAADEAVSNYRS